MLRLKKKVKILMTISFVFLLSFFLLSMNNKTVKKETEVVNKSYNQVQSGEEKIEGTDYVIFDAFFLRDTDSDGNAESYRGASVDMAKKDKLYLDFKVLGDVTLKSGTVEFVNDNVRLSGSVPKSNVVKQTYISDDFDKIEFNSVGNGLSSLIELNVNPRINNNEEKYSGTNKVIFTGIVVDNVTKKEKEIKKEISYKVDWYTTKINMNSDELYSHFNKDTLTATYTFKTYTDTDAIIRDTTISGTVSSLIGVAPEEVVITSSSGEVDYTYDKDSQVFIATKVRKEVDGKKQNAYDYVNNSLYYNSWTIKVKYPSLEKALYNTNINVSIDSYAYATNNPDVGYEDKRSNVVNQIINYNIIVNSEGNLEDSSDIEVGTYSYKNRQYNIDSSKLINHFLGTKEDNFTYPVKWYLSYKYTTTNTGKVIVKDKKDFFKSNDDTKKYITYKTIKISNPRELKGTLIKVINNDNDEVLYVYNEKNFGEVYEFPRGINSIRLETDTHEINVLYRYTVEITKEIDNEKMANSISLAKFNTYTQLTSGFEIIDDRPGNTGINKTVHQESAYLTSRLSKTYVTLDKNSYEPKNMADTTIPMNIKINHCSDNDDKWTCNVWKKEKHLLIFSENITDVELPTLNSYSGYSLEKTMIGDKIGVKVTYNNETSSNLTTNLNLKVTINPKSLSGTNYIEVYSADEAAYKYQNPKSDIYDINGNGKFIDQVNYTRTSFDLIVPKELVTGAQIKNYDSKDSVTISPLIADVEIMDGKQEADMEIFMINNSTNAVDGIVTMGRIGYVGNTYQIGTGELGTEYNTNIKSAIQVPDEIKDKTKVYYSDKENPTKDIKDVENNWVENPNDFSTIKNYMIVVDPDYSLESGKELAFTYKISIPNKRANLMKVSYFNHGVYFNYLTDNGRYATSSSSGKLGVRISRKVNLNITNTKIFSTNKIKGTTYRVESEDGEVLTGTTDALGKVKISGLYAEKNYKLVQASINSKYVKDEEEKTFKIVLDENNNASLEKTGIYKSIEFNDNKNLNVSLENDMYYTLRLNISDIDTGAKVGGSSYTITGKNFEDGRTIYTDENGVATLDGLEVGQIYRLTALSSNDYIPMSYKGEYGSTITSFDVVLTRNNETKEVNLGINKAVEPKLVYSSNSIYKFTPSEIKYDRYHYYSNNLIETIGPITNIYEYDLTNYYGDYKFLTYLNYKNSRYDTNTYLKLYFSDTQTKVKPFDEAISYGTINKNNDVRNVNVDGNKIIGGKKYYFIIEASKRYGNPSNMAIDSVELVSTLNSRAILSQNGFKDLYFAPNATKSLYNYDLDNTENPIYEINAKVKATVKYDLVISKVDKDTKKILKGALFKIEGPGFVEGGKYLETDENGKIKVNLNAYLTGSINEIPGLENGYSVDAYYTITEVQAPLGYRIENKPIKFRYIREYSDSSTYKDYIEYVNIENINEVYEFDSYKISENEVNVTIGNSPIVKITKKDADTGELLPNTYFTIERVEYLNGLEQLTPAKSISGTILGEKITIDGKTYYAVKTDKNGSLNLNLGEGTYKLKEIKASSEKYNITDEVYYFGVGKSVNYQPAGAQMTNAKLLSNPNGTNHYTNVYMITSDGGYLTKFNNTLYKYDEKHNLEWDYKFSENKIKYKHHSEYIYLDGSYTNSSSVYNNEYGWYNNEIIEVSDGFLIQLNECHFLKIDKEGNYVFDTFSANDVYYRVVRNTDGKYTYYYLNSYIHSSYVWNNIVELPNGNLGLYYVQDLQYNNNYYYGFKLKDGSEFYPKKHDAKTAAIFLELDKEGKIVNAKDLTENIYSGIEKYINDNKLDKEYTYYIDYNSYPGHFKMDNEGNFIIINDVVINNYRVPSIIKFDKNFNCIYYQPLSFYGNTFYDGTRYNIEIFDDGSFSVGYYGSASRSPEFTKPNHSNYLDSYNLTEFLNTKSTKFEGINLIDPDTGYEYSGRFAVKYNKNAEIENVVELSRYRSGVPSQEQIKFNRMYHFGYDNCPQYIFLEDGSVIAAQTYQIYDSTSLSNRTVYLANGDKYLLPITKNSDDSYGSNILKTMIYKINPDSSIEWVRVYDDVVIRSKSYDSYDDIIFRKDNNKILLFLESKLKSGSNLDMLPSDPIDIYDTTSRYILAEFEISDKITPASPESYVLDLVNKVKEFGITIMTNEGGSVVVKDGEKIIYQGSGPKEVEKVKFSADSKYDIIIKPNEGYGIVSIKVNDEDATYTVNEDGTVLLDKIKNVQETKNISIEFKKNVSRITVHHYLNGTKTRIYSDQVITGEYGTKYNVLPIDSKLYTLIKNKKGEYVFPDNYEGTFKNENQEVIFYYTPRTVKLLVSYYEEGTTNKLSETTIKEYVLGSKYIAKALNIKHYELSSVLGEEEGFINEEEVEVTYFYKSLTKSKITVIYKNVEDGTEIEKKEFEVDPGSYYDTEGLSEIPEGYELKSIDGEPNGIAEYESIVVTYNYGKIKEKVEVPETGDNIIYYIIIGIISLITLILSTKYIVKRKAN